MTGVIAGLQNMVSNFGGVIGSIVTGFIVAQTGSFTMALLFSAFMAFLGILNYVFLLGRVEPIRVAG